MMPFVTMQVGRELDEWTRTVLGQALIRQEREQLDSMLAKLYGPIAIQYGALDFSQFLRSSNAIRRIHSLSGRTSQEPILSGVLLYFVTIGYALWCQVRQSVNFAARSRIQHRPAPGP